ncbi:MAG: LysM peptidoglycan-binding domain-containing protein [Anaerolineae bacterium]|nr:LysM peptidoglycan-binding domain-containing protein [Anaerolineae bacterium]
MEGLCGKGIWLAHSYDLQRAVEMATRIEGSHLLAKVGHGPHYFPESARGLVGRIRSLGFSPLAWLHVTDRAPEEAAWTIVQSLELGYEAVILYLGAALLTGRQLQPLAEALRQAEVPAPRLLVATPPPAHLPDRAALEVLAPLCQGGWMPLCFPIWGGTADDMLDFEVYQALPELSLMWGRTPEIYPVLSPQFSRQAETPFLPEDLIPWVEAVMRHGVDFFSVYHAALAEKALWPILQTATLRCQPAAVSVATPEEPGVILPQPVYITVSANDTVWGIISRHGLSRTQFWEWNGHLWDSRGLPRDADYLQAGWRVRVK